jgi:isopenicillin N synthase-like dioxygenase
MRRVPELSLAHYINGADFQKMNFVEGLFHGIKDYGFIILKDHNIPTSTFERAYQLLEILFSLPEEQKLKYYHKDLGGRVGYTPFGKEHAKDSPVMDLKEFWHISQSVPAGHKYSGFYPENIWPSEANLGPLFQQTMLEIYRGLEWAGEIMLEALTGPLQLPQDYFYKMVKDGNSVLRLLHYPPISPDADPRCLRAAPHEDINLITILPAATAGGLQLKDRDGKWLDVNPEPHTLIVDAGDMLSRITNDVIPSTTHQVVNVESLRSRYSMPFFMHPNPEATLTCIPSCMGERAKYPDILAQDFLMQRLREIGLVTESNI